MFISDVFLILSLSCWLSSTNNLIWIFIAFVGLVELVSERTFNSLESEFRVSNTFHLSIQRSQYVIVVRSEIALAISYRTRALRILVLLKSGKKQKFVIVISKLRYKDLL